MLISYSEIIEKLNQNGVTVNGALHIGAHDCEELPFYQQLGLNTTQIVWIDAFQQKVEEASRRNIPNVYHATITDKDDDTVTFNLANNVQSSSVLPFGTHSSEHPGIVFVQSITQKTTTVDTFFKNQNFDPKNYNFWNFDIQGAELMALKGAKECLPYVDTLYLEVNEKYLYEKCGLIGEIDEFLSNYQFQRVLTNITQHGWGDALYLRKK